MSKHWLDPKLLKQPEEKVVEIDYEELKEVLIEYGLTANAANLVMALAYTISKANDQQQLHILKALMEVHIDRRDA